MSLLADLILSVHVVFVLFVVAGFALILTGLALDWCWVRNFRFRALHLAAILFVAAESVAGFMCPLTLWEDALRGGGAPGGLIQRWVHQWLYYTWPEWVFTVLYVAFAALVAFTFWAAPPERRAK
jgi:hypothetical protein